MSLEDKLLELKRKEAAALAEQERRKKQIELEREIQRRKDDEQYSRLEKNVKDQIEPLLNAVNNIRLQGRGEVSNHWSHITKDKREHLCVLCELRWDYRDDTGTGHMRGNSLTISTDMDEFIVIAGDDGSLDPKKFVARVNANELEWQEKIEEAIISSLSPNRCSWDKFYHVYDPG